MQLDAAMALRRTGDATFGWEVPDTWQQGRGAFGGLVIGAMIGAAEAVVGDAARPLRALTATLAGPALVGPATIAVRVLRAGSSVTVVEADLDQGDGAVGHGVVTFGRARGDAGAAGTWHRDAPPALPPWRDVPIAPVGPPAGPAFIQHWEVRPVGGLPFRGGAPSAVPEVTGWTRPRAPGATGAAALMAACCDSYWPAVIVGPSPPRLGSTLTFALTVVGELSAAERAAIAEGAPLAYRGRALGGGGGYVSELRELWSEDGRLLAVNAQTLAVTP